MFTGIIEHLGTISRLDLTFAGGTVTVQAPTLTRDLSVSASVAVNGCCLTVVHRDGNHFFAELSRETLAKTSLGSLKVGARVNLEQAITATGGLDHKKLADHMHNATFNTVVGDVTTLANPDVVEQIRLMVQGKDTQTTQDALPEDIAKFGQVE